MRVISASDLIRSAVPVIAPKTPYALRLRFAGVVAELRAVDNELTRAMQERYRYHVTSARADFTYYAVPSVGGYRFWCAHDGAWEWQDGPLPVDALVFLADAALMSAVVHARCDLCSIHAAAVALNGKGALIAGDSTAGKTTTLLACGRAGLQMFSDERALLRSGQLQPFVRRCQVRDGGRVLLLGDDDSDALAGALRGGIDVDTVDCFGPRAIAKPCPLKAAFILQGPERAARLKRIDAATALSAVARWFDTRADAIGRIGVALATLRATDCYALTLGPPAETARAIRTVLEKRL